MNKIIDICRSAHRRMCPFYQNDSMCRLIDEEKECDMKCSYMRDYDDLINENK